MTAGEISAIDKKNSTIDKKNDEDVLQNELKAVNTRPVRRAAVRANQFIDAVMEDENSN